MNSSCTCRTRSKSETVQSVSLGSKSGLGEPYPGVVSWTMLC